MNTKNILLVIAGLLIVVGVFKPDFSGIINTEPATNVSAIDIKKPSNTELLDECESVTKALKNGSSSRKVDGKRLASLYLDLATLISLDSENSVIKNTEEVRQANSLAGIMLRLDIKGEYKDLAEANTNLIKAAIGDDNVSLDSNLRARAVDGFKALAWACYEGSK